MNYFLLKTKTLLIQVYGRVKMNKSPKLSKKAKQLIPGETMLFSKKPDLHLPDFWPSYYKNAKDCYVWDLNNQRYLDMMFYTGTNVLGYSNKFVNDKVKKNINSSVMSTLNCPEEVYLAEKIISLHNWADSVRFCRSGGEANSIAIRIARAASMKDKVAICGYHGWHDWYMSANINDKNNLNTHLLTGLGSKGVPKALKNTVFPFEYGNLKQLKKITNIKDLGIIKMELSRSTEPDVNFLKEVRKICNKKNIILIFDECTSGFRQSYGGLHLDYTKDIYPDMSIFGKALGNGYAINAIIGKKEIMKAANNSFISSTFWTERIGPTAALATLEYMKKYKTWKTIKSSGKLIKKEWLNISNNNEINISIGGIDAIPSFNFIGKDSLYLKTFFTQEMLKRKILASNVIFMSIKHKQIQIQKYLDNFNEVFKLIRKYGSKEIKNKHLKGQVCISSFSRMN